MQPNETLLPNEQEAKDFVMRIGKERATRIIESIHKRFKRRYNACCDDNRVPINPEWVYQTKLERELKHRIAMGLKLTDDYNTPEAAHARILERIKKRNADRAARKAAANH